MFVIVVKVLANWFKILADFYSECARRTGYMHITSLRQEVNSVVLTQICESLPPVKENTVMNAIFFYHYEEGLIVTRNDPGAWKRVNDMVFGLRLSYILYTY